MGAVFARLSTIAKFGALAVLVLLSFLLGGGAGATIGNFTAPGGAVEPGLTFGIGLAGIPLYYLFIRPESAVR